VRVRRIIAHLAKEAAAFVGAREAVAQLAVEFLQKTYTIVAVGTTWQVRGTSNGNHIICK
jgi:hypothetical protein